MNEQLVATILLYGIQLFQAGMARSEIVDAVRAKEVEGQTPEQISAYLKALADEKLDWLNSIQRGPDEV